MRRTIGFQFSIYKASHREHRKYPRNLTDDGTSDQTLVKTSAAFSNSTIFSALRHGSCQRLFLFAASSSAAIFIDAISTALTSPRSNGGECIESAGFTGFQPTH